MSHPKNRRERFLIGDRKGRKRVREHCIVTAFGKTEEEKKKWREKAVQLRRNTTKLCSCDMCQNLSKRKDKKWLIILKEELLED